MCVLGPWNAVHTCGGLAVPVVASASCDLDAAGALPLAQVCHELPAAISQAIFTEAYQLLCPGGVLSVCHLVNLHFHVKYAQQHRKYLGNAITMRPIEEHG